ncbi:MAG: hypothetical protein BGO67_12185 [Alphaproteobacteria bacterium 41-28]|nr:MAG: hypothetical protein BGO67_12185 [Alphaproteobacteria bacterium 41-28]
MAKKLRPKVKDDEKIDIKVESWQWERASPPRFSWKHWLILALIIAVAILFAFGFLIIASVVLIAWIVIHIVLFIFKKLS